MVQWLERLLYTSEDQSLDPQNLCVSAGLAVEPICNLILKGQRRGGVWQRGVGVGGDH